MLAIVHRLGTYVANLFKSRRPLEVENLFLRHQLNIALRRRPPRSRLRGSDRARACSVWRESLSRPQSCGGIGGVQDLLALEIPRPDTAGCSNPGRSTRSVRPGPASATPALRQCGIIATPIIFFQNAR